jgi:acyl-[acyl-carrier-protein] desaturase
MDGWVERGRNGWSKWIRQWTGGKSGIGNNTLSGVLICVKLTTQHLINDGFDIGTGRIYKNFVYTSFQELALMFLTIE